MFNLSDKKSIIDELKKMPILTKDEVLLNSELFLTEDKKKLNEVHTGGNNRKRIGFLGD